MSRDLCWEALVEATGAKVDQERGALNAALKSIRDEMPGLEDETLAEEIRFRARSYRRAWPTAALTPMALAKHWNRIQMEARESPAETPAPPEGWSLCGLCGNMAIVFVAGSNDCVPCPECNRGRKSEIAYYGYEGAYWANRNWVRGEEPHTVVIG
jgi:hypothetical protein